MISPAKLLHRGLEKTDSMMVVIYGAGGHGKVVADILRHQPGVTLAGFIDDCVELHGKTIAGYRVLGGFDLLQDKRFDQCKLVLAIGDNRARRKLSELVGKMGYEFANAIHPSCQLGSDVSVGKGTVMMANVVVNAGSVVGNHAILNTGATVDHDCLVGDFCHISPGVHLAGGVTVEEGVHVGIGASVLPNVRIGRDSVIGAGAAVTEDIPPGVLAVGVPTRVVRDKNPIGERA